MIDPFALDISCGDAQLSGNAAAVRIAASSNNILKAADAAGFADAALQLAAGFAPRGGLTG